ncbi:uncharacterized protein LOC116619765 [Nematostella vectensis]|uniref:uncharacterized protein LOC116619765 n=1 Tax=Nematostella vectensis TaxID=45351 RepID=UPI00139043F4|nr:uncharacterized protein LOC116619765 [Nematostella vectensis]XP_048586891.1 uncharacterized protein LOC116619765 [Nematostella vectensis]XP_048586892.1 uncharacterized protein LOC116619765 [Nematostella vectensis]XP_048586894.1 uncharacterized protein LOC116619765 [Nematostella vectensis]XP_048586895.1 uncharacterized protein LOC116619765 [Nematostella vectensis]XP_048586896.1 uncharacterized protein LOC116619765 [Nematostella vectensis]XP_048586897.1 uncharacterized protein LOC116619765 [
MEIIKGVNELLLLTVTLVYKALVMLLRRKDGSDAKYNDSICNRGINQECCVFCKVIRGCDCPDVSRGESCSACFLKSKANIGSWKVLRDDLTFPLDEELSHVNLCALHCEIRNTEQLLSSLGLFAFECGSLNECNAVLSEYGPDSMKERDKITVKVKPGQTDRRVEKHNIQVSSFSGSTERRFLHNIEDIIVRSLPLPKLMNFKAKEVSTGYILDQITFCEEMIQVFHRSIILYFYGIKDKRRGESLCALRRWPWLVIPQHNHRETDHTAAREGVSG